MLRFRLVAYPNYSELGMECCVRMGTTKAPVNHVVSPGMPLMLSYTMDMILFL